MNSNSLKHRTLLLITLAILSASPFERLPAADWTQWSGNDRLCQWNEEGILDRFPAKELKPAWTTPIGSGYSGPVVSAGKVVVTDYTPKEGTKTLEAIERVVCLKEETGEQLWEYKYETAYRVQMQSYATGPRGTPVIHDGRVYAVGATGQICCLNLEDGSEEWRIDATKELGAGIPVFGVSCSPLVWKDTLICSCGGSDGLMRALDVKTGKERWKGLPARCDMPYSAPEILTFDGDSFLVQWYKEGLAAMNPDTGELIWTIPFPVQSNMAIGRPVVTGNRILISGFYNGSALIEVNGTTAKLVWKNGGISEKPDKTKSLHAVMTTPIIEGDYFYGTCSYGELRGLLLANGSRLWEDKEITRQGRWGSMFWVKNKDRYFVNTDKGELVIMQFTPEGPKVLDRAKLIEPDTHCGYGPRRFADDLVNWVMPAYANGHIIIRNDSEIRRVSLKKINPPRDPLAPTIK